VEEVSFEGFADGIKGAETVLHILTVADFE
jgi:hypothetical protein